MVLQFGAPVETTGAATNQAPVGEASVGVKPLEQVVGDAVLMLSSVVGVPVFISEEVLQATNEHVN